jgi:hypothetical protein
MNTSPGLFTPGQLSIRDSERPAPGRGQAPAVGDADTVEASSSPGKRVGDEAPDARDWVASAEIRPVEALKPSRAQIGDGPGRSDIPTKTALIDPAEPSTAKPVLADQTRPLAVARSMVALLLASSAGLVYRYGRAARRTSREFVRRMSRS